MYKVLPKCLPSHRIYTNAEVKYSRINLGDFLLKPSTRTVKPFITEKKRMNERKIEIDRKGLISQGIEEERKLKTLTGE